MVKQNEEPPLLAPFSASNHQDAPLTARATLLSQQLTASFMLIKKRNTATRQPNSFPTKLQDTKAISSCQNQANLFKFPGSFMGIL